MTPVEHAHAELNASRSELSTALTRQVDFLVKQMEMSPADAAARVRSYPVIDPEEREPDQVSWFELGELMEREPERGEALWQRLKDHAANEQATGVRASRTIEPKVAGHPIDRARFAAILAGLKRSLAPRDALEDLLIQQMACAYELHLYWQDRAALRAQEEEWEGDRDRRNAIRNMSPRQLERYELDHGWLPPRVSTAEAIEQAVMISDRYQRSFLRLLKAYRDMRRLVGTLVVAGGQVNIGEQQVNVAARPGDSND